MDSLGNTIKFDGLKTDELTTKDIISHVVEVLEMKGYDPINQLVGYLISGDPSYIPRDQESRNAMRLKRRDEIIEDILRHYIGKTEE